MRLAVGIDLVAIYNTLPPDANYNNLVKVLNKIK